MLRGLAVEADRCHQHEVAGHVDAIDLDHQEVQLGQVRQKLHLSRCADSHGRLSADIYLALLQA